MSSIGLFFFNLLQVSNNQEPTDYARNFTYYAMLHCSIFFPLCFIMLNIYFIPQFPCFAKKIALFG